MGFAAKAWKTVTLASLFTILLTLGIELFFPLSEKDMEFVHAVDLAAICALFIDFALAWFKARNRMAFIKKNWLLFLSFLPFGASMRLAGAITSFRNALARGEQIAKMLKLGAHASRLARVLRPLIIFGHNAEKKILNLSKPKKKVKPRKRGR